MSLLILTATGLFRLSNGDYFGAYQDASHALSIVPSAVDPIITSEGLIHLRALTGALGKRVFWQHAAIEYCVIANLYNTKCTNYWWRRLPSMDNLELQGLFEGSWLNLL